MNHSCAVNLSFSSVAPPPSRVKRVTFGKLIGECQWGALAVTLFFTLVSQSFAQPFLNPPQNSYRGGQIFSEFRCATCHVVSLRERKVVSDLTNIGGESRSLHNLAAAMWSHLPKMAAQMRDLDISLAPLGHHEAADLISFLYKIGYFDPSGDIQSGRQLFVSKRCVVCHQVADTGGVTGPALNRFRQYWSPVEVAATMWNHSLIMSEAMQSRGMEYPKLEASELSNLLAYLLSTSSIVSDSSLQFVSGRPTTGRTLIEAKGCKSCHRIAGSGGDIGPELADHWSLLKFATALWNKGLKMNEALKKPGYQPIRLDGTEMADIVAYLTSVGLLGDLGNPKIGERLVSTKGCSKCHTTFSNQRSSSRGFGPTDHLYSEAHVISSFWNHYFATDNSPVSELSVEEIPHILAYFRFLKKRAELDAKTKD